jgi:hypothetical protein
VGGSVSEFCELSGEDERHRFLLDRKIKDRKMEESENRKLDHFSVLNFPVS